MVTARLASGAPDLFGADLSQSLVSDLAASTKPRMRTGAQSSQLLEVHHNACQANRAAGSLSQPRYGVLGIRGRLPAAVETLDQQAGRAYAQLQEQPSNLHKYIYLNEVHDRNQALYFKLLGDHLDELLPVVYDPTVGEAIEKWSLDYRDSRAVYSSIDRPEGMKASFQSLGLGPDDVDLIVVSDAQESSDSSYSARAPPAPVWPTRSTRRCCETVRRPTRRRRTSGSSTSTAW
ncbi:hypothetical protein [Streptomyces sp. NPDC056323]|uniref:hypothetical protein n=1 Tax=Streptomyces sp. NPDC056323 TaxID=3345784 RepID=UPI0035DB6660